jgi:hypothetical protein
MIGDPFNPLSPLSGIRIVYSTAACTYERNRTYAKRRAKSAAHWRRMDKKYLKRYGQRSVPAMFTMQAGLVSGPTLVVHPALKADIDKVFKEASTWQR